MADDNKKDFALDMAIDPYGECKRNGPPPWFAARPKLSGIVQPIKVKQTLRLDARKWKMKDIESGAYAVARYHLAMFDTALTTIEKSLDKEFDKSCDVPKQKRDIKFYKALKKPSKDQLAALETAEKKTVALWKKVEKGIEDKVSLALDELAQGTDDNKDAIAAGKKALKVFERENNADPFTRPINRVSNTMRTLAIAVAGGSGDSDDAYKTALRELRDLESDFERSAQSTGRVARMFLALGAKMAKDKGADPALQKFGNTIARAEVKQALMRLAANIRDVGQDLDKLVNFVARGDQNAAVIAQTAVQFKKTHEKKTKSARAITAAMRKLADDFKKIEKKLK